MRWGKASALTRLGTFLLAVTLSVLMALPVQAITRNASVPAPTPPVQLKEEAPVTEETASTGVLLVVVELRTGLFAADDPVNMVDPSGEAGEFSAGGMSGIMNIGLGFFAAISPVTATTKTKAQQVSRTGTIWFNVGFDNSIKFTDNYKNKIRQSLERLDTLLSRNCRSWGIIWSGKVKVKYDWHPKPSPKSGSYTGNEDFSNGFGISGHAGGIPFLVTKLPINSGNWRAVTQIGVAILYNIDDSIYTTLAHETGHYAGYKPPKPEQYDHSDDPTNIMGVGDDTRVNADKDYCEKVTKLAK
jgi:hypothetical protein